MIALGILGGALVYPYTVESGARTYVAAFFEQFCVQGIFGIIPIHLLELSPPEFSTFIVGTSYNLGLLISSPSNTILIKIAEQFPLGQDENDYGMAIRIFIACVYVLLIVVVALGPENRRPVVDVEESGGSSDNVPSNSRGYELNPWSCGRRRKPRF
jgi:MFS transporter, SHS family, lactate transporter